MVKIRLTRVGAKKYPFYRVIAIDERKKRSGRPLEFLGTYDPTAPGKGEVKINIEGVDAWLAKGAQMSSTVGSLVQRARKSAAAAPAAAVEGTS